MEDTYNFNNHFGVCLGDDPLGKGQRLSYLPLTILAGQTLSYLPLTILPPPM